MASSRDAIWSSLRLSASSLMMYENNSKLEGRPNDEHCLSDLKAGGRGEQGHGSTWAASSLAASVCARSFMQVHGVAVQKCFSVRISSYKYTASLRTRPQQRRSFSDRRVTSPVSNDQQVATTKCLKTAQRCVAACFVLAGFRRGYRIWILASGSSEGRPCTSRVLDACIVTAEAGAHAAMQREFERKQCASPNMH